MSIEFNSLLKVDLDGTASSSSPTAIATIQSVHGLDVATLSDNGNLVVPV